jgi:hypothetical protein
VFSVGQRNSISKRYLRRLQQNVPIVASLLEHQNLRVLRRSWANPMSQIDIPGQWPVMSRDFSLRKSSSSPLQVSEGQRSDNTCGIANIGTCMFMFFCTRRNTVMMYVTRPVGPPLGIIRTHVGFIELLLGSDSPPRYVFSFPKCGTLLLSLP